MSSYAVAFQWVVANPAPPLGVPPLLDWLRAGVAQMREARIDASSPGLDKEQNLAGDNDDQDVLAAQRGDGEAYARLIRRYQQAISAYMWRFTRDRGRWEELVHDVFVEAYFSLRTYRGKAPLLHWLRRIATRVGYRHWRHQSRQRTADVRSIQDWDAAVPGDSQQSDAQQAAQIVHATLQQLAPRDRLVLTLLYLEGCTVADIAALTGWSQTMVKVQAYRARARLKRLLQPWEDER